MRVTRVSAAGVMTDENGTEVFPDREQLTSKPLEKDSKGYSLCRVTGKRICSTANQCEQCKRTDERLMAELSMMPVRQYTEADIEELKRKSHKRK
jgi:muconolactone delta-isomerase